MTGIRELTIKGKLGSGQARIKDKRSTAKTIV
jgi:hypothetical protein